MSETGGKLEDWKSTSSRNFVNSQDNGKRRNKITMHNDASSQTYAFVVNLAMTKALSNND